MKKPLFDTLKKSGLVSQVTVVPFSWAGCDLCHTGTGGERIEFVYKNVPGADREFFGDACVDCWEELHK